MEEATTQTRRLREEAQQAADQELSDVWIRAEQLERAARPDRPSQAAPQRPADPHHAALAVQPGAGWRRPVPGTESILDSADCGVSMDAKPLVFALAGLMVADSGAGKSGVMLAMAEVVTACREAVALNLVGAGVGDLGEAITLNGCMDDEKIVATLQFLLTLCSARAPLRALRLGQQVARLTRAPRPSSCSSTSGRSCRPRRKPC